jgi:hypothetical protein
VDTDRLTELIEGSDADGLLRFIDGVCTAREYEDLVEVRARCLSAVGRGKQLWGVAQFAEYRLALEAPPKLAATAVVEGAGRFAMGPLWEVAASSHGWDELAPHVDHPRMRALVAYERAIRGDEAGADESVFHLPFRIQSWEPDYPVATYKSDTAEFPAPDPPAWEEISEYLPGPEVSDIESEDALEELCRTWADQSAGTCVGATVEGSVGEAIGALADGPVRVARIDLGEALRHMVWAGASGGAHGSRRGTAVGRINAWAALATLGDLAWPADPAEVGAVGTRLEWALWQPAGFTGGWALHLAVADPDTGLAWGLAGHDQGESRKLASPPP